MTSQLVEGLQGDTIKFLELINLANERTINQQQERIKYLEEENQYLFGKLLGRNQQVTAAAEYEPVSRGLTPLRYRIKNAAEKDKLEYEKNQEKLRDAGQERETVQDDASSRS